MHFPTAFIFFGTGMVEAASAVLERSGKMKRFARNLGQPGFLQLENPDAKKSPALVKITGIIFFGGALKAFSGLFKAMQ